MLINFPNGSRTKNLRTPHGSSAGPYSIRMPAFLARFRDGAVDLHGGQI
jgi:hypothetical protein